jgi:hypothetical protein
VEEIDARPADDCRELRFLPEQPPTSGAVVSTEGARDKFDIIASSPWCMRLRSTEGYDSYVVALGKLIDKARDNATDAGEPPDEHPSVDHDT